MRNLMSVMMTVAVFFCSTSAFAGIMFVSQHNLDEKFVVIVKAKSLESLHLISSQIEKSCEEKGSSCKAIAPTNYKAGMVYATITSPIENTVLLASK